MTDLLSQLALDEAIDAFLNALDPVDAALQRDALRTVINRAGGINRETILPFLPDLTLEWAPAVAAGKYVPQVSRLTRLAATATTPPTTGNAVIALTIRRPGSGLVPAGTLVLLQGEVTAEVALQEDAPAGSWLFATVPTPNGASGVSITAVRRLV